MDIKVPFLKSEVGAGDLVKRATDAVGIRPCGGCKKRQEAMNRALTFGPVPEGPKVECGKAALVKLGEGVWIVWSIVDGKYANSHRFVGLDEEARQEYVRRCR